MEWGLEQGGDGVGQDEKLDGRRNMMESLKPMAERLYGSPRLVS